MVNTDESDGIIEHQTAEPNQYNIDIINLLQDLTPIL